MKNAVLVPGSLSPECLEKRRDHDIFWAAASSASTIGCFFSFFLFLPRWCFGFAPTYSLGRIDFCFFFVFDLENRR